MAITSWSSRKPQFVYVCLVLSSITHSSGEHFDKNMEDLPTVVTKDHHDKELSLSRKPINQTTGPAGEVGLDGPALKQALAELGEVNIAKLWREGPANVRGCKRE